MASAREYLQSRETGKASAREYLAQRQATLGDFANLRRQLQPKQYADVDLTQAPAPGPSGILQGINKLLGKVQEIPREAPPENIRQGRELTPAEQRFQQMSPFGKFLSQGASAGANIAAAPVGMGVGLLNALQSAVTGRTVGGQETGRAEEAGNLLFGLEQMLRNLPAQSYHLQSRITGTPEPTGSDYYRKAVESIYTTAGTEPIFTASMLAAPMLKAKLSPGEAYAKGLRKDAGRIQTRGDVRQGSKGEGGPNLELEASEQSRNALTQKVGAGSSSFMQAMSKSMEPVGPAQEPINAQNIAQYFQRTMDVPIRYRRFRGGAAGIYKTRPEVVRTKERYDLGVMAHEVSHHLDKKVGFRRMFDKRTPEGLELSRLDYTPEKGRVSEGFAEYMRHWLTGSDDPVRIAPLFTEKFNKWLADPANTRWSEPLLEGRKLMTRWANQGAVARLYGQIDAKPWQAPFWERTKEKIGEAKRAAQYQLTDVFTYLEHAEKKIRNVAVIDPKKIRPDTSPTLLARAGAMTAAAKARAMVLDGTFDFANETTGPSLRSVLSELNESEVKPFLAYAYARRGVHLLETRGINPGFELGDGKYTVEQLKSPKFDRVADGVTAFEGRVMKYLVDAGGLAPETAQLIVDMNPFHIPLKRSFEGMWKGSTGTGKKLGNVPQAVKRIHGSDLPLNNPLESIVENTAQIISMADRIRVGRAFADLAKTPGAGKWIEKIPRPMQLQRVSLTKLAPELKTKLGIDISQLPPEIQDQVLTFWSNAPKMVNRENIVSFWRDGKEEFYQLDPDVYRSIMSMDPIDLGWIMNILRPPARAVRLGATGLQPGFIFSNLMRDVVARAHQSEYGTGLPEEVIRAFGRKFMGHEISHKYTRSGSEMSHFIGLDREHLKRAVAEVLASDTKRKALNVVRHPIEALKACFSVTETGPRLAEFESAYKELLEKWQSKEAATVGAVNAAAEVTINFRRSGRAGQVINQIIPFWNATVQGGSRFVRFAKQHPARAAFKGITALTIPTYILWDQNKDEEWYKKMPTWLKYGFWHIKVGDTIVRIPRPFEWSLPFSAMPEAALNQMYEENPGEVLRALRQQGGNMMPDLLPASIRPIIEVQANYDFFRDNYIVPPYTKKSPEDQYREWTTLTSREIGKLIGYSPEKIDHMIRGYTGGLGLDLIQAAEGIGKPSQIKEPADYPMVGRFFTRDYSKFQEEKKKTPSRPKTRRPERPETR